MSDKDNNADKKEPILPPPKVIKHSADNIVETTRKPSNNTDYKGSDE